MEIYDQLESIKYVVDNSNYVKINYNKIKDILPFINDSKRGNWLGFKYLNKELNDEDKIRFLVLCELINFSYWGTPKWKIEYNKELYSGYHGLFYALVNIYNNGINLLDSSYIKSISIKDFDKILYGNTSIPMIEERYRILKEYGNKLDKFGNLYNLFIKAKSDKELLSIIVDNFNNFRDISIYKGKEVFFFKRAILLVEDLFLNIEEIKNNISNIDDMVACADYKVPQVLRQAGILEYNKELSDIVDNEIELKHNSEMEIEIRANMIYAVELIKEELNKNGLKLNSIEIDNQIWLLSKNKEWKAKPYHLTRSINY